ncbi:hypothetical protein OBBRIDRAFT_723532 [Obba rivulosa]|uniref:Metal homeostatis protein bsd2 n=1 Tax=Obba rivulosa TaxID=1052685 RepID=A0A8E2J3S1_9APHY|nr:hypothetical protein OBBRIDRAFT_723532 [Obba rivulosa]
MHARYAPIPGPHNDTAAQHEMEAAFDDSDSDDDDHPLASHTRNGYHSLPNADPTPDPLSSYPPADPPADHAHSPSPPVPGAYDFENVDYDYTRPPPGSPPQPSAHALPNEHGNSNGLVPSFDTVQTDAARTGWFRRTAAAVLPTHYVQRLGLAPEVPRGAVGGGTSNDGVFANVTAKPSRPIRIQDGDETYLVPEDAQKDAPPSYAAAQADAVPPYWETTIHAPSAATTSGEVIIDGLVTGSLFSFLWNMLVSISFQFVGFLLTYLLHTTHAAKLGSRAGLGITLIQYGFAMRSSVEYSDQESWWKPADQPRPTFDTAAEAEEYFKNLNATAADTMPSDAAPPPGLLIGDATSEWLSFLLMTIGWFILLTSLLSFWRVKRWERGILSSQSDVPAPAPADSTSSAPVIYSLERVFGLQGLADGSLVRSGLGFGDAAREEEPPQPRSFEPAGQYILPLDPDNPEHNGRIAQAFATEARLHQDLRSAGLI